MEEIEKLSEIKKIELIGKVKKYLLEIYDEYLDKAYKEGTII